MNANKDWAIDSNPVKQTLLSVVCFIMGILFIVITKDFKISVWDNNSAGFLLGVMLLIIGVAALLQNNKRLIIVQPSKRQIFVEDNSRFGRKERLIFFDDIEDAYIDSLGSFSEGSISYDVVLKLKNGKHFPLFRPAVFDGAWDKNVMEARREKLLVLFRGNRLNR